MFSIRRHRSFSICLLRCGQESFSFRPACSATALLFVDRRCWWQSVVMKNRAFLIEHRFPRTVALIHKVYLIWPMASWRVTVMECHRGGALSWSPLAGVSRPHLWYRWRKIKCNSEWFWSLGSNLEIHMVTDHSPAPPFSMLRWDVFGSSKCGCILFSVSKGSSCSIFNIEIGGRRGTS